MSNLQKILSCLQVKVAIEYDGNSLAVVDGPGTVLVVLIVHHPIPW